MLGYFRYILAMMVACSHLWNQLIWWQGIYAVHCFYLVSGYLMSLVLLEVYKGASGVPRYAVNRMLRIYPPYLVAFALSLAVHYLWIAIRIGGVTGSLQFMPQPADWPAWLGNLTLVWPWDVSLMVSQGWSLRVELVYYALLPLLVRDLRVVVVWVIASLAIVGCQSYDAVAFGDRYGTVPGASLAFSLGSLVYHLRDRLLLGGWHLPFAAAAFVTHLLVASWIWRFPEAEGWAFVSTPHHYGLYTSTALGGYLMLAIASASWSKGAFSQFGDTLGKLAYPIFLTHWVAAYLLITLGVDFENKAIFVPIAFILIHLLSVALYMGVERPINRRVRDRIRALNDPGALARSPRKVTFGAPGR